MGDSLRARCGLEFIDSDREIEDRTGVDIPLIFELEGESGYRKREKEVIDDLTARKRIVLATGGGAILDPVNRRHLAARGTVIYLHTSVDQQLKRTAHDRNRPLLQTSDPGGKLRELMEVREPLYRELADWVIDTDGCRARDVVQKILHQSEQAT